MKKIIIIMAALIMSTSCYADYAVVDKYDRVISKVDQIVNKTGHERRKEKIYDLPEELKDVDVADLRVQGNKIVKREYSQQELQEIERQTIWNQEEYDIFKFSKNKTIDDMIASGYTFKYDHKLK